VPLLTRTAALERGGELALADDTQQRTWAELDERVNRLANAFTAAGLGHSDSIASITGGDPGGASGGRGHSCWAIGRSGAESG